MKILQFPLARISIFFLAGILFFTFYKPLPIYIFGSLALCICFLTILCFLNKKRNETKLLFGTITLLTAFLIGTYTAIIHKENYNQKHYANQIKDYEKPHLAVLIINEKIKNSTKNTRYIAKIKTLDGQESFGKTILNIKKPNQMEAIAIGTKISVFGTIYKNKNPFNPNQFDYGKYLEKQEIYAQIYTCGSQIEIGKTIKTVWSEFSNFRTKIILNLEHSHFKKDELNVLVALLLGQQQDISPEILKDYQYAGAVHILSVSGLHVGFVLMFVAFLLKPISNTKKGAILKLILILICLWIFGIIAGLSASVMRSVAMFSIVAIGNHLRRTTNIFHTLLVSILLILLFRPSFLFDIGFQLSYLALFFILWLQPLFSSFWQPKNKIISYFWDIVTVSFAAQIGAMPLSFYYFHQFPGLFFITNIVVLPLLGIIMIFGLLAVIIACFSQVPMIIEKPLEILITILNDSIHWVATFEDFIIKNISFTHEMLWSSYLVIVLGMLWFEKQTFKRLAATLSSVLLLQTFNLLEKVKAESSAELIVYNAKKETLITERKNNWVTVYSNDSILQSLDKNSFIQSYLVGNFCNLKDEKTLKNVLYFKAKKILIIDSTELYIAHCQPDFILLTHSPKLNLERVVSFYKPKQIIMDGSNKKSYIRLWEATCRKEKIPFHNTNEKGFYKI